MIEIFCIYYILCILIDYIICRDIMWYVKLKVKNEV